MEEGLADSLDSPVDGGQVDSLLLSEPSGARRLPPPLGLGQQCELFVQDQAVLRRQVPDAIEDFLNGLTQGSLSVGERRWCVVH